MNEPPRAASSARRVPARLIGPPLLLLSLTSCRFGMFPGSSDQGRDISNLYRILFITAIPVGWSFGGSQIRNGRVRFWLNSDRAGWHAAEVTVTRACDTSNAVRTSATTPSEPGISRYEQPISLPPRFELDRYDVFAGGCVTYRYVFQPGASSLLVFDVDQALSFFARSLAVQKVDEGIGLNLCGAEAPPCPG